MAHRGLGIRNAQEEILIVFGIVATGVCAISDSSGRCSVFACADSCDKRETQIKRPHRAHICKGLCPWVDGRLPQDIVPISRNFPGVDSASMVNYGLGLSSSCISAGDLDSTDI